MPTAHTFPGAYIEEVSSGARTIIGVATSIALFIGWAARGRIDEAVRIAGFADYDRTFGGLDRRTQLGHAVKHFFDNGGSDAYVVRLVGPGAVASNSAIGDLTVHAHSPGGWGNDYAVRTTRHPAPDDTHFTIDVLDARNAGTVIETFQNVSMAAGDTRFVESVINDQSAFITVRATGSATPPDATVALGGGDDGTRLTPGTADFHDALDAVFGAGSITDRVELFNLVCVPGETDPTALGNLQTRCRERRSFLIVDADPAATVASLDAGVPTALTGPDAMNSAIFFPWVRAGDPLQPGASVEFAPSGFVAGVFARTDASRGVWKAPAGADASIGGATGLAVAVNDDENDRLNALGINCLRTFPGYGNVVWGSRTLHGQNAPGSEWKYIPVRRMALFLEESLYRGIEWAVFEPNDEPLWAEIRLAIGTFMQGLFRQGAFQGATPSEAYFVKCDSATTTQADIDLGVVNILVGFAPLRPAEFVIINMQQMAGDTPT